jgi:hypothetical protein
MQKFKRRIIWLWDYYCTPLNPSDHFHYMELKYGQQWYDYVEKNYEERFG